MSDSPADAVTLYDEMRATEHEQAAPHTGDGDATIEIVDDSHVDVAQAENQFHVLERRMTQHSTKDKDQDSVKTATVEGSNSDDPEKGKVEPERFDLREYLSSSNDANAAAGIKHKVCFSFSVVRYRASSDLLRQHVGVVWEDLQVDVLGGAGSKVSRRGKSSLLVLSSAP